VVLVLGVNEDEDPLEQLEGLTGVDLLLLYGVVFIGTAPHTRKPSDDILTACGKWRQSNRLRTLALVLGEEAFVFAFVSVSGTPIDAVLVLFLQISLSICPADFATLLFF
jgi:hypothetical protein